MAPPLEKDRAEDAVEDVAVADWYQWADIHAWFQAADPIRAS